MWMLWGDGRAGVDLYILNFEEGNEVDLVQGNYPTGGGRMVSPGPHRAGCLQQLVTL